MTDPASHLSRSAASFVDPRALMCIRNLELRARKVMEGFWKGIHRSPYHGFSVEFTEYRPYTTDDDPRHIDWRVYARTDRYYIKKFEDETNLRCFLLSDQSRSMTYGSVGHTKSEYAATLAATLASFLYLQGDAVGLLTFDEQIREYLPARHRPGHLRHLMIALEKPSAGHSTNLSAPLQRIAEMVRKRGLMVLLSDFLAPIDRFESQLVALAACGHEIVVFQVLDPAEISFEFHQATMFQDVETDRQLFVDPVSTRKDYLGKLEDHCAQLRGLCGRLGIACHRLSTDRPLELALFEFLRERLQSSRHIKGSYRQNRARSG